MPNMPTLLDFVHELKYYARSGGTLKKLLVSILGTMLLMSIFVSVNAGNKNHKLTFYKGEDTCDKVCEGKQKKMVIFPSHLYTTKSICAVKDEKKNVRVGYTLDGHPGKCFYAQNDEKAYATSDNKYCLCVDDREELQIEVEE